MNDDLKTSYRGLALIKRFEGLFLKSYDDATGHVVKPGERIIGTLTIGYGHTSAVGPPRVYVGQEWTEEFADKVLASDLVSVELEVKHLVKVALTQNQFDALVSFQYNTGWLAHHDCSLLSALNLGNYHLADEDFMLYDRAQGRVLSGLSRRRAAEMALFMGDDDNAVKPSLLAHSERDFRSS